MYDQLHQYLVAAVEEIRGKLGDADVGEMRLTIEASGRTLTGDVLLTYHLADSLYSTEGAASGGDLTAVVKEFLRRHEWENRHAPVCLPRAGDKVEFD